MQSVSDNFHQEAYYLQMDVRSFFMSIKKDILSNLLNKKLPNGFYKDLLNKVIYHNPTTDFYFR
ncbi:MAG: hypothetical protein LBQ24_05665 [Candidatus Peribacteria bacterium]|jgi:hypothetical protein|nr:hypothetical protein [Candidatus Peribacteria bacterium]